MKSTINNKTFKTKTIKNKTKKRVFKQTDYNAGDGFLTSTWGPPIWHYLHTMSFNYPVNPTAEDKKHYRDFILNLKYASYWLRYISIPFHLPSYFPLFLHLFLLYLLILDYNAG